jgi:serine/threonine protein kinase
LFDYIIRREEKKQPIPEKVILKVVLGVCLALKELHDSNPPIAHRDIKVLLSIEMIMYCCSCLFEAA